MKLAFPGYDEEVITSILIEQNNGDVRETTRALLEMYMDINTNGDMTDTQQRLIDELLNDETHSS